MRILIAPNSFKDCLSSMQIADLMEASVKRLMPESETVKAPISDGGDGFFEVLSNAFDAETRFAEVEDPLGRIISCPYSFSPENGVAVIEMAKASGLALLKAEERNPMKTSSIGTGQAILSAIEAGAEKIILGIGGSATCDLGIGIAHALGWRFFDSGGNLLRPVGGSLSKIASFDSKFVPEIIGGVEISLACDVSNELLGEKGAARFYAPQKGASPEQVEILEESISRLSIMIIERLGTDVRKITGGGAAGGAGAGLCAFLEATLEKGTQIVFEARNIEDKIQNADLVLGGEGQIDSQTVFGKAPGELAKLAKKHSKPCIAICGGIRGDISNLLAEGMSSAHSICSAPMRLEDAISNAPKLIMQATEMVLRSFLAGRTAFPKS